MSTGRFAPRNDGATPPSRGLDSKSGSAPASVHLDAGEITASPPPTTAILGCVIGVLQGGCEGRELFPKRQGQPASRLIRRSPATGGSQAGAGLVRPGSSRRRSAPRPRQREHRARPLRPGRGSPSLGNHQGDVAVLERSSPTKKVRCKWPSGAKLPVEPRAGRRAGGGTSSRHPLFCARRAGGEISDETP